MAGIKTPILDIMNRLDSLKIFQHIRIWNNQIEYEQTGEHYDFPKPAAFVEYLTDAQYIQMGGAYQTIPATFRIHICHEQYDAGGGTFEQNLEVFDLRDAVCGTAGLSLFEPTNCGALARVGEAPDYEHNNIYHWTIDFKCEFFDSTGSPYDPANGNYIDGIVTGIQVDGGIVSEVGDDGIEIKAPGKLSYDFKIPQK